MLSGKDGLKAGALLLTLPELAIKIHEEGDISVEKIDQDSPSRMVVAECMILHNQLAGRFARNHGIPLLYRSQGGPSERLPAEGMDYVLLCVQAAPKAHSSDHQFGAENSTAAWGWMFTPRRVLPFGGTLIFSCNAS
jgi:hypothetical protein